MDALCFENDVNLSIKIWIVLVAMHELHAMFQIHVVIPSFKKIKKTIHSTYKFTLQALLLCFLTLYYL